VYSCPKPGHALIAHAHSCFFVSRVESR
jgi:hypothetical protein